VSANGSTAKSADPADEFDCHELDEGTLVALADLACGDDGPCYRQAWQLVKLLERAGWHAIPEYFGSRRDWLSQALVARRYEPGQVAAFVRRLGDAREYHGEPKSHQDTVEQLNEILKLEGFRLVARAGGPVVLPLDEVTDGPRIVDVELRTTIAQLVVDPEKAALLQRRLDEAKACRSVGAHLAAVIMMGSALEGVLFQVLLQRAPDTPPNSLYALIDTCHARGWIETDARRFTQELRDYRNLVHPNHDVRIGQFPDLETSNIFLAVLNATLNDLADSAV
jgi:hypothetical protein